MSIISIKFGYFDHSERVAKDGSVPGVTCPYCQEAYALPMGSTDFAPETCYMGCKKEVKEDGFGDGTNEWQECGVKFNKSGLLKRVFTKNKGRWKESSTLETSV